MDGQKEVPEKVKVPEGGNKVVKQDGVGDPFFESKEDMRSLMETQFEYSKSTSEKTVVSVDDNWTTLKDFEGRYKDDAIT